MLLAAGDAKGVRTRGATRPESWPNLSPEACPRPRPDNFAASRNAHHLCRENQGYWPGAGKTLSPPSLDESVNSTAEAVPQTSFGGALETRFLVARCTSNVAPPLAEALLTPACSRRAIVGRPNARRGETQGLKALG